MNSIVAHMEFPGKKVWIKEDKIAFTTCPFFTTDILLRTLNYIFLDIVIFHENSKNFYNLESNPIFNMHHSIFYYELKLFFVSILWLLS